MMAQSECTSLGAAMLAASALGWIDGLDASPFNRVKETLRPEVADKSAYDRGFEVYRQIYQRLKSLFQEG